MVIVPKELWKDEIKRYLNRLESASDLSQKVKDSMNEKYPGCFWAVEKVNEAASIASRLVIYAVNVFTSSLNVRFIVAEQWKSGLFIIVPLNTRFVLESWGAIHFARATLIRLIEEGNIKLELNRVNKLTFGTRDEIKLPWGEVAEEKSYNVMNFIDCLKKDDEAAEDFYNFLCEGSHPNLFQNMNFQLMGPPLSNWDNKKFNEHGHELLEKTLSAFEKACYGMESDILDILETGERYINQIADESGDV